MTRRKRREAEVEEISDEEELLETAIEAALEEKELILKKPAAAKPGAAAKPAKPAEEWKYEWDKELELPTRIQVDSKGKPIAAPEVAPFPLLDDLKDEAIANAQWSDGTVTPITYMSVKELRELEKEKRDGTKASAFEAQPSLWEGELRCHTRLSISQCVDRDLLLYLYVGGSQRFCITVRFFGPVPADFKWGRDEHHCYQLPNTNATVQAALQFMLPYAQDLASGKLADIKSLKEAVKAPYDAIKQTAKKEKTWIEVKTEAKTGPKGELAPKVKPLKPEVKDEHDGDHAGRKRALKQEGTQKNPKGKLKFAQPVVAAQEEAVREVGAAEGTADKRRKVETGIYAAVRAGDEATMQTITTYRLKNCTSKIKRFSIIASC